MGERHSMNDGYDGWPLDGKPAWFEDLTAPIEQAIRHRYRLVKKKDRVLTYLGPDLPETVCTASLRDSPTPERVEYEMEDQGRDELTILIGAAMRLGIEQGRRIEREETQKETRLERMLARARELAESRPTDPLPVESTET